MSAALPMSKALHPDTMLAWEMNGEPLTPLHGYPLRLVVPGWYGMCSVKWLAGVHVLDREFEGFYQIERYRGYERPGRRHVLHLPDWSESEVDHHRPGPWRRGAGRRLRGLGRGVVGRERRRGYRGK